MAFGGKIHSEVTLDLNFTDVQIPTKGVSARAFQVGSTSMVPEGWQSGVMRTRVR